MKCASCGTELAEGAAKCSSCGRESGFGQKVEQGTLHAAEKTGEVAGKIGKGIWGGAKAIGSGAKKGFKGSEDEKKDT